MAGNARHLQEKECGNIEPAISQSLINKKYFLISDHDCISANSGRLKCIGQIEITLYPRN